MATSSARADRVYHQDYIARIRYSNTLPPPPNPPKLLNIPNTGLESGQYTSAAFASRLAREQPLNIEADAELGMPIDLIGLPGVFENHESYIRGFDPPPAPHPHDRPLLRSLAALGKSTSSSNVSFLRRTDFVSSTDQGRSRYDPASAKDPQRSRNDMKKRKRLDGERDDSPAQLLRTVVKGFNLAYPMDAAQLDGSGDTRVVENTSEEKAAWNAPKHPKNSNLTLLDSYPVLPDLEAFPDPGNYLVMKFATNPVAASDSYDSRLDVGLLRPLELSAEDMAESQAQIAASEADPTLPKPGPLKYNYEFFLPQVEQNVPKIRKMLDMNDAAKADASLYDSVSTNGDKRYFRYERVRAYETYQQSADPEDLYGEIVALALHNAEPGQESTNDGSLNAQTAAYVYPVVQRTFIRPRRATTHATQAGNPDEGKVDFLEVTVRDPDETEIKQRGTYKAKYENMNTDEA